MNLVSSLMSRVRPDPSAASGPAQSSDDAILDRVEIDLASARELKQWWEATGEGRNVQRTFSIERAYHEPELAYGFFDEAHTSSGVMPVMGTVQEMFFDQPKTPREYVTRGYEWSRQQIREFVLRYFLRVADFRDPETYARSEQAGTNPDPGRWPGTLSWCPQDRIIRKGFGFSQHFYKLRASGEIGKFPDADQNAIVDLRELFTTYEWIVLKVKVYDFAVRFRLLENGPELVLNLDEESYLVLASDFIRDTGCPRDNVTGEYGFGYAYLRNPQPGLLAYGPGEFDAAFKLIRLRAMDDGRIFVRMNFVSNRPTGVVNLRLDPLAAAGRIADVFTLGLSSRLFGRAALPAALAPPSFDPVYAYVSLLNGLTAGRAARDWCVSREQLDMQFLVQHFQQHYKALAGAVFTWRLVCDWLDESRMPEWVVTGESS